MQTCELKTQQGKMPFKYTSVPFFGEVISRHGVQPSPQKLKALTNILPPETKNLETCLDIISYLGKFSTSTADVC